VPRSGCCCSNAHVILGAFLFLFWKRKRSRAGALPPADFRRSDPLPAPSLAALPATLLPKARQQAFLVEAVTAGLAEEETGGASVRRSAKRALNTGHAGPAAVPNGKRARAWLARSLDEGGGASRSPDLLPSSARGAIDDFGPSNSSQLGMVGSLPWPPGDVSLAARIQHCRPRPATGDS
jgi:hypothetical protein